MAASYPSPPELQLEEGTRYGAVLTTNMGQITIAFDAVSSPKTVNNFVFLAREGFYDGVIFHRIVPGFVIQGGDPTGTGRGGPGYGFADELSGGGGYTEGTVAMANAGPNTNGSQFFICVKDVGLPHAYSIFGQVIDGMDVVHAIAGVTCYREKPVDDVVIESVEITEA